MKKLNNMWFGVLLTLSILFVGFSFASASVTRGYEAFGGEVFTVALPIGIVSAKITSTERKLKKYRKMMKSVSSSKTSR